MQKEKTTHRAKPSSFKFIATVGVLFLVFFISFHLVRLQVELAEKKAVLAKLEEQKQELMISNAEKKEMIEKTSKIVSEAYGLPIQTITVIIEETNSDNVGVAGEQLSERLNK